MPEVAICRVTILMSASGAGIVMKGVRLEYPLEYLIQHFSDYLPLVIQHLL
jgi:hypothetical protein